MKKFFLIITMMIAFVQSYSQSTVPIRGDTIKMFKTGGNAELILENGTRNRQGAFLRNRYKGRLEFAFAIDTAFLNATNDSLIFKRDTQRIAIELPTPGGSASAWTDITGKPNGGLFIYASPATQQTANINISGSVRVGSLAAPTGQTRQLIVDDDGDFSTTTGSSEIDPIFTASDAFNITATNKSNWTQAYNKYVNSASVTGGASKTITFTRRDGTTFTAVFSDLGIISETDPVFGASQAASITALNKTQWTIAYNDRIVSGVVTGASTKYITLTQTDGGIVQFSFNDDVGIASETDPIFSASGAFGITSTDRSHWTQAYDKYVNSAVVTGTTSKTMTFTRRDGTTFTATWTESGGSETDPIFTASPAFGIDATDISNWTSAFDNMVTAVSVTGTTSKTINLTLQSGEVLSSLSFTDLQGITSETDPNAILNQTATTQTGAFKINGDGTLAKLHATSDVETAAIFKRTGTVLDQDYLLQLGDYTLQSVFSNSTMLMDVVNRNFVIQGRGGYLTLFTNLTGDINITSGGNTVVSKLAGTGTRYVTASSTGALGTTTLPSETDPIFGASAASAITSTDVSNWNTAYTNRITSLTTTGTGAATLSSNVLNIPTPITLYSGDGTISSPRTITMNNVVLFNGTSQFKVQAAQGIIATTGAQYSFTTSTQGTAPEDLTSKLSVNTSGNNFFQLTKNPSGNNYKTQINLNNNTGGKPYLELLTGTTNLAVYSDSILINPITWLTIPLLDAELASPTMHGTTKTLIVDDLGHIGTGTSSGAAETDPVFTASQAFSITGTDKTNWTTGYNDKINSIAFSGTNTKTLTLTQQDAGTVSNTFTDISLYGADGTIATVGRTVTLSSGATLSVVGGQQLYSTSSGSTYSRLQVLNSNAVLEATSSGVASNRITITQGTDWELFSSNVASGTSSTISGLGGIMTLNGTELIITHLDTDLTPPTTSGTTRILVADNTGHISTIASSGVGGEANTASNLGGGLANFDSKSGVDLRFNSFTASDFNLASNLISIDYTNGQSASTSTKGFLTNTDWNTFNNKQSALTFETVPVDASTNPVESNGIFDALALKQNLITVTTTGTSGAATFNQSTGALNIPNYATGSGANALGTYIVQTSTNAPTNAQILGSLATGIVKNTTTTGVLSIAVAADFPTLNQNTTGTSANVTDGDKGDITIASGVWGIDASSVALGDIANISAHRFLGNNTASSAAPIALTAAELTAELDVFTTTTKGLVPSPAGTSNTTDFLRRDGTWAAPAGGSAYTSSNGITLTSNNFTLGGALTASTSITGAAGSFSLSLGTTADRLGGATIASNGTINLNASSGTIQINGQFQLGNSSAAIDANYTVPETTSFATLGTITANRTVTFPGTGAGKVLTLRNSNASAFKWTIVGTAVKDAAGITLTEIPNTSFIKFINDGTNWIYSAGAGGYLSAGPGTTTMAQLNLQAGTFKTIAAAGDFEYDGNAPTFTSKSGGTAATAERGYVVASQLLTTSSNNALTAATTGLQACFPAANDAVQLSANTTYRFRFMYYGTRTSSATAAAMRTGFTYSGTLSGTPKYWVNGLMANAGTNGSGQSVYINVLTAVNATNSGTSVTNFVIRGEGEFRTTTAGLLVPSLGQSVSTGVTALTIDAESYFEIWPVGSNTVVSVGTGQ
jgi:hypothetical protein